MAIYQVEFNLNDSSNAQKTILSEESLIKLSSDLPIGKSWHNDLVVYGELESTCVCVWKDSDRVEISCRFDVSSLKKDVLNTVIDFAKANDLMLVYDGQEVPMTFDSIKDILINSPAYKFLENPNVFFDNI